MNDQVLLSCALCIGGLAGHIVAKWAEHREADPECGIIEYLSRVAPAKTVLAILGAITVLGALFGMDWLNPGAGLMTGWGANSAVDNFNKRLLEK